MSVIRRAAESQGAFVTILHRGHEEAGTIHVIFRQAVELSLWCEATASTGERGWRCRKDKGIEADIMEICEKERRFDPDLWIIEIDGVASTSLLPGPVIDD